MKKHTVSIIGELVFLCETDNNGLKTWRIVDLKEFNEAKKLLNIT